MKTLRQILEEEKESKQRKIELKIKRTKVYEVLINDLINILDCSREKFIKSRERTFAFIRHGIAYLMDKEGFRDSEIASLFGKDRTTSLHSVRVAKDMIETNDADFMPILNELNILIIDKK